MDNRKKIIRIIGIMIGIIILYYVVLGVQVNNLIKASYESQGEDNEKYSDVISKPDFRFLNYGLDEEELDFEEIDMNNISIVKATHSFPVTIPFINQSWSIYDFIYDINEVNGKVFREHSAKNTWMRIKTNGNIFNLKVEEIYRYVEVPPWAGSGEM